MSCHGLVEEAPSIYGLDHRQCYQKAYYILCTYTPKWVLTTSIAELHFPEVIIDIALF